MTYAKRRACALIVLLLLGYGCYWAYRQHRGKQNLAKVEALAQTLAADQTRKLPEPQRQELRTEMRTAMSQLTAQQRGQFFSAQRQRRTDEMKKVLKMPKQQQIAHLDREIKQSEERRRQFQQMQKAKGASSSGTSPPTFGFPGGAGKGRPSDPAQRELRSKQRLDRTTPEERAVSSEYRKLVNQRRTHLGLPPSTGRGPR